MSAQALSADTFTILRDLLARYSGVYLDPTRQRSLETSLATRLAATRMAMGDYVHMVTTVGGRGELHQLAELLLNHETFFFRNQPHIHALRKVIIPQIHRRKPPGEPLRIWSAGCATGEEPYSLAITLLETLGTPLPRPIEVWATDLSNRALDRARAGCYAGRSLTHVTPELRSRYFEHRGDSWCVRKAVRDLVHFDTFNLLDTFPAQARGVDMIFCQNVTIYFQLPTCRALMERFYATLPEGGLLFLGFSETLWKIFDGFQPKEVDEAFVYVKPTPDRTPAPRTRGHVKREDSARSVPTLRHVVSPHEAPHAPTHSEEVKVARAHDLIERGHAEAAITLLNQVQLNGPWAPRAIVLIARAHANRGDLALALAEAQRAREMDNLTSEAYLLLGVLYARQGQYGAAIEQLERARYLEPDSGLVAFHLAESYRQTGALVAARREYRNALRRFETYPPEQLVDGVAVSWVCVTCRRYLESAT